MKQQEETKHYVYVLRCCDGSLYTGWTTHLEERVKAHNEGRGAKYTRSHKPVTLVYFEVFSDKSEALRRECAIKAMPRQEKEKLIESRNEKA